jgi:hypothetical protein
VPFGVEELVLDFPEIVVMLSSGVKGLLVAFVDLVENFLQMPRFSQFFLLMLPPHLFMKFASLLVHKSLEIVFLLLDLQHGQSPLQQSCLVVVPLELSQSLATIVVILRVRC